MTRKKRVTFEEWIDLKGVHWVAEQLGVTRFTVLGWRARRADPRVDAMRRIKRLTRGLIGYEQMIERDTPTNSFRAVRAGGAR